MKCTWILQCLFMLSFSTGLPFQNDTSESWSNSGEKRLSAWTQFTKKLRALYESKTKNEDIDYDGFEEDFEIPEIVGTTIDYVDKPDEHDAYSVDGREAFEPMVNSIVDKKTIILSKNGFGDDKYAKLKRLLKKYDYTLENHNASFNTEKTYIPTPSGNANFDDKKLNFGETLNSPIGNYNIYRPWNRKPGILERTDILPSNDNEFSKNYIEFTEEDESSTNSEPSRAGSGHYAANDDLFLDLYPDAEDFWNHDTNFAQKAIVVIDNDDDDDDDDDDDEDDDYYYYFDDDFDYEDSQDYDYYDDSDVDSYDIFSGDYDGTRFIDDFDDDSDSWDDLLDDSISPSYDSSF